MSSRLIVGKTVCRTGFLEIVFDGLKLGFWSCEDTKCKITSILGFGYVLVSKILTLNG